MVFAFWFIQSAIRKNLLRKIDNNLERVHTRHRSGSRLEKNFEVLIGTPDRGYPIVASCEMKMPNRESQSGVERSRSDTVPSHEKVGNFNRFFQTADEALIMSSDRDS